MATPRRPIRVLIVDDEVNVRSVLAKSLATQGYAVATASNGHEASVRLDRGDKFDIVITDYSMPHANGLDVLRKMRVHLPQAKGVLMSGQVLDLAIREEANALAEVVIAKPFSSADLFQTLRALLDATH